MRNFKKRRIKKIAVSRINTLFLLAEREFANNPERSHRYVEIARKISMKARVKIPKTWKRRYCKHCHRFLVYGENCRVRTRRTKVVIKCLECGKYMRIPFVRERKKRRILSSKTIKKSDG